MKKFLFYLLLFSTWVPALHAGYEEKTATGWCTPLFKDKECATTVCAAGCGSVSMVCCGSYMGGLCVDHSLLTPVQVMTLGSAGACVGFAGAVACAVCARRYAQQAGRLSQEQPTVLSMNYPTEVSVMKTLEIGETK